MVSWRFKKRDATRTESKAGEKSTDRKTLTGSVTNDDVDVDDGEPLSAQEMGTLETTSAAFLYGNNGDNVNYYYKFMGANPLNGPGPQNSGLSLSSVLKARHKSASLHSLLAPQNGKARKGEFTGSRGSLIGDDMTKHSSNTSRKPESETKNEEVERAVPSSTELKIIDLSKKIADQKLVEHRSESGGEAEKPASSKQLPKAPETRARRKSFFNLFGKKNQKKDDQEKDDKEKEAKEKEHKVNDNKVKELDIKAVPLQNPSGNLELENKQQKSTVLTDTYPADDLISPTRQQSDILDDEEEANLSKLIIVKDLPQKSQPIPDNQGEPNYFFAKHVNRAKSSSPIPSSPVFSETSAITSTPQSPSGQIDAKLSPSPRRDLLIFERNVQERPSFSTKSSFVQTSPQLAPHKSTTSLRLQKLTSPTSPSSPVLVGVPLRRSSTASAVPPGVKSIPNHLILDDYVLPALDLAVGLRIENGVEESPRRPLMLETSLSSHLGGKGMASSSTSLLLRTNANGDISNLPPASPVSPTVGRKGSMTFDISDAPPLPQMASTGSSLRRASLYTSVTPYDRKRSIGSTSGLFLSNFNRSLTELQKNGEEPKGRLKSNTVTSLSLGMTIKDGGGNIVDLNSYADILDMEDGMSSKSVKPGSRDDGQEEFFDAMNVGVLESVGVA